MKNIIKILERLNDSYIKRRLLVLSLTIQNIILSLIMLMYANMIITKQILIFMIEKKLLITWL